VASGLWLEPPRVDRFRLFRTVARDSGVCLGDAFVYVAACVALGFLSPAIILRRDACGKRVFFGFVCVRMCVFVFVSVG
jgi:hypothetical protein